MQNNMTTYEDKTLQPMTIQDWIITWIIMIIPVVNIVMIFVWAFGAGTNKSKKTYFQAYLILIAVATILGAILGMLIVLFGSMVIGY